ncbi:MAG: LPS export ABC transporter periplasmic protein LptC [Bacteroidetes bacterium]|nr:MAG: LPS export ABC transporter periplasmic protein LptC [Bacteroidota bacterium]
MYSDSAQVKIRISGDEMLNHLDRSDPFQEFTKGVFVEFFGPQQTVSSTLSARYAVRYEREGEVIVRDSVVWISTDGQMLETEELIWDEQARQIYTHKFARITTPNRIIYGHGFRANQDFSHARILEVDGIVPVEP